MPNALTGDFEAVLQLSEGTVNRLLASMHQNAFTDPSRPSFPHAAVLRIGDGAPVDGVVGSVRLQMGSPRISFLHGVTDRFRLEVAVRARYKADPGSTPLAEFISGTVTAEYHLAEIGRDCPGYRGRSGDYVWARVVEDSVRFAGTARDPQRAGFVPPNPDVIPRITRQVAELLARGFVASPHLVDKRFRRGSVRTLTGNGEAAACVAVPLANEPSGDLASVNRLFLEGANMAVAISSGAILGLAIPVASAVAGHRPSFKVTLELDYLLGKEAVEATYLAGIATPRLDWLAYGSHSVIRLSANGSAKTANILLPDFTFQISLDVFVSFDAASQDLTLGEGPRTVNAQSSFPVPRAVLDSVASSVDQGVRAMLASALAAIRPATGAITARSSSLLAMLRTFDAEAQTRYDAAEFSADGMVLRGSVELSRSPAPVAEFGAMTDEAGYSAFGSWIPGGRVDEFRWSWSQSWFGSGETITANSRDRFVLQRPVGRTKWGGPGSEVRPEELYRLPGFDGIGRVCVEIHGVSADSVSGDLVAVRSRTVCRRFGLPVLASTALLWRHRDVEPHGESGFRELAVIDLSTLASNGGSNTLLLKIGEQWDREHEVVLLESLNRSKRDDAGLAVVVVLPDGRLESDGHDLARHIESLGGQAGAPVLVNEDVMDSWSKAFALLPGRDGWRLISPGGGVTWMHDGRTSVEDLTLALDEGLFPSGPPRPVWASPSIRRGARIDLSALTQNLRGPASRHCPPYPKSRFGLQETVIAFTLAGSRASAAQLKRLSSLAERKSREDTSVAVVMTGACERELSKCQSELSRELLLLPDPDGAVARSLGVSSWPMTIWLNSRDVVVKADFGLDEGDAEGSQK